MNQTYFECYEFDVNVGLILIATCTYKPIVSWILMNRSIWISVLLTYSYWKFYEYLWVAKKRSIADLRYTCLLYMLTIISAILDCQFVFSRVLMYSWIFLLFEEMDPRNCIQFCVKNKIKCLRTWFEMLTVTFGLSTLKRTQV